MFWPVLWLSLRAFVRWTGRMIEAGHGFAGLRIEITWYGWIHVEAIDLSDTGKDFRRHMAGVADGDGWAVLHRASGRVETLLLVGCIEGEARYGPSTPTAHTDGAYRFAPCTLRAERNRSNESTGPPLGLAPFPQAGRGAALYKHFRQSPAPVRAQVLVKWYLSA
ncbi:MAG: hypothetical protein AAF829_01150 [Pseudomonadota bacterium]